jgi:4-hydroxythreonine-4-phosphate dehydrogenase
MANKINIGITCGDLNGIGLELIIKTLEDPRLLSLCTPIVYANSTAILFYEKLLKTTPLSINHIETIDKLKPNVINCVSCWTDSPNIQPGTPDPSLGKYAYQSLERASVDLAQNKIQALVTAPIDKSTIHSDQFPFTGHTEYFADRFHAEPLMLLVDGDLRVATLTTHLPVKDIAAHITTPAILKKITIFQQALMQDFAIERPRIAVLALNPHAGDNGLIGDEEIKHITPAIQQAKKKHQLVFGPYPADGFFAQKSYEKFDGVLAMYHDQGLVPFKTLSKHRGTNFTAGLPIVRTSPDHGTAYDIVGTNVGDPTSMRNALFNAIDIHNQRNIYLESHQNPLKKGQVNVGYDEIGEMEKKWN